MRYFRKFLLFIVSTFLVSLLISTISFWTLQLTLGDRNALKTWFSESGAYDNFVKQIVSSTASEAKDDTEIASIDEATLQIAAADAFPPELLQNSVETIIDESYDWLEQENDGLEFIVDLRDAKQQFIANLSNTVEKKANSLPACASGQIPSTVDVFTADCLPAIIQPDSVASDFERELQTSEEFLNDPVFTAADLVVTENGVDVPFAESYSEVPAWYQKLQILGWVSVGASILASIALVLLATRRRKGLLRLARAYLLTAFSVGMLAVVSQNVPLSLSGATGGDAAAEDFGETIVEPFLERAIESFAGWSYVFAGVFAVVGIIILIVLFLTRAKKPQKY